MTYRYIDVSEPADVAALNALVRIIDEALGYPRVSSTSDGSRAPECFDIVHHTVPMAHPTQAGRWMMPINEEAAPFVPSRFVLHDALDASWSESPADDISSIGMVGT